MYGATQNTTGSVVFLWRYPVKSMMGEQLGAVEVIARGLLGDRAYALMDAATLEQLGNSNSQGRFEARRFRPNVLIDPGPGQEVRLQINKPCPRCVMTTLPQGDLPQDTGILRTAAQENKAHVGVYASVLQGGTIRCGDAVRIVE